MKKYKNKKGACKSQKNVFAGAFAIQRKSDIGPSIMWVTINHHC